MSGGFFCIPEQGTLGESQQSPVRLFVAFALGPVEHADTLRDLG